MISEVSKEKISRLVNLRETQGIILETSMLHSALHYRFLGFFDLSKQKPLSLSTSNRFRWSFDQKDLIFVNLWRLFSSSDHSKGHDGVFVNSSYYHCVVVTLVHLFLESIPRLFLFPRSHLSLPGTGICLYGFSWLLVWILMECVKIVFFFLGFFRFTNGMWWDWREHCSLKRGSKLIREG